MFVGIRWMKRERVWRAQITTRGRVMELGKFKELEDAQRARKEAEKIYRLPRKRQAMRRDNTSGHPGVTWVRNRKKWQAKITVNHKRTHLGMFDRKEDAIEARKKAEEKIRES